MIIFSFIIAIIASVCFFKYFHFNVILKSIVTFFIFFITLCISTMVLCYDELEAESKKQTEYYDKLQMYADSINNIYMTSNFDNFEYSLNDSLEYYYNKINTSDKIAFFENNAEKFKVNKILNSYKFYVENIDEIELYNILSKCESKLKENLKDPDSYERINYNFEYKAKNQLAERFATEGKLVLNIKYRARNSFNGYVIDNISFTLLD